MIQRSLAAPLAVTCSCRPLNEAEMHTCAYMMPYAGSAGRMVMPDRHVPMSTQIGCWLLAHVLAPVPQYLKRCLLKPDKPYV